MQRNAKLHKFKARKVLRQKVFGGSGLAMDSGVWAGSTHHS
jgi:hypothetical protein